MSRDNRQTTDISKCARGGSGGGEMGREGEGKTEETVGGGRPTHALDFFSTLTNTLPGPTDQSNTIPPFTRTCVKVRCRCKFKNTWSWLCHTWSACVPSFIVRGRCQTRQDCSLATEFTQSIHCSKFPTAVESHWWHFHWCHVQRVCARQRVWVHQRVCVRQCVWVRQRVRVRQRVPQAKCQIGRVHQCCNGMI